MDPFLARAERCREGFRASLFHLQTVQSVLHLYARSHCGSSDEGVTRPPARKRSEVDQERLIRCLVGRDRLRLFHTLELRRL
ncbi:hypothetical protein CDL60_16025 [Roseateles noduli]|nr:hypothetical protein CDL60_16025 [Roseateles noduli]